MYPVLLIDDDRATFATIAAAVAAAGYDFVTAASGRDALEAARRLHLAVALIELALPDMPGIDVLRELRKVVPRAACLIVSRCESPDAVIEAMRAGACDWLRKPVSEQDVLAAIERAGAVTREPHGEGLYLATLEPHAHQRLADRAVRFIGSPNDAPTLRHFAREVGVSVGGFRNWRRTGGVKARTYLNFARVLRAVYRREHNPSESLENILQIIDKRTLGKLIAASGGSRGTMPSTVDDLLEAQQLISPEAARAIRVTLAKRHGVNKSLTSVTIVPNRPASKRPSRNGVRREPTRRRRHRVSRPASGPGTSEPNEV